MNSGSAEAIQHHIQWLQLTQTEAEQLMLQKFFLEELTGLHHLHLLLEHYAFLVWETMSLLEYINLGAAALDPNEPNAARIKQITEKLLLISSSDVNITGQNTDLLAVYRKGMDSCGAKSTSINTFAARLRRGESEVSILKNIGAGPGTISHVKHTTELLQKGSLHQQIAALCFTPRLPKPKVLLNLIDQLDRKLPVLLMRIRYYFDLELMLQQEVFVTAGKELLEIICAADAKKWAESKQIITDTALSRAAVLADVRAAIKKL